VRRELELRSAALLVIRRTTEPRAILAVPPEESEEEVREVGSVLVREAAKALGESWQTELQRPALIPDDMLLEGLTRDTLTAVTDAQRRALGDATDVGTWARAIAEVPDAAEALALLRDLAVAMGDDRVAARAARLLRLSAPGAVGRHGTAFGDDDVDDLILVHSEDAVAARLPGLRAGVRSYLSADDARREIYPLRIDAALTRVGTERLAASARSAEDARRAEGHPHQRSDPTGRGG
jgi:hypothetical protein